MRKACPTGRSFVRAMGALGALAMLLGAGSGAAAQPAAPESSAPAHAATPTSAHGTRDPAPAPDTSVGLGGPSSVGGTLGRDARIEPSALTRYFAFKERMQDEHGFSFGADYFTLYQKASSSPGEDHAAGGVFRFFGSWDLVGRRSKSTGGFVYKIENRHRLGTPISPQDLGFEVGYVGLTAITFSDIRWALTNLYWQQSLLDGRLAFVAGYVDNTDYVDVHALVDPWNDFMNLAVSTDATIPIPNQGLGAALRFMITDQVYVLGGLSDTNGDPTDPGGAWSSFFDTGEHFTHVELGWISSLESRFTDNVHVGFWHADEREEAEVPGGWGVAASWSQKLGEVWQPFVRGGYSDGGGALWERSLSAGLGRYFRGGDDVLSVGLSWGRPNAESFGPGLGDQVTAQVFYHWRPLRFLHVIPDFQLLFDPALNPEEDVIAAWSVRARLAF